MAEPIFPGDLDNFACTALLAGAGADAAESGEAVAMLESFSCSKFVESPEGHLFAKVTTRTYAESLTTCEWKMNFEDSGIPLCFPSSQARC